MEKEDEADGGVMASLGSISRGAVLFGGGRGIRVLLNFLTTILLTNGLGVVFYGFYAYARTLMLILVTISDLGASLALVRYLPPADHKRRCRLIGLGYINATAGSILLASGIVLAAPRINIETIDRPLFTLVLQLFALWLPFGVLTEVTKDGLRGLELPKYQVLVEQVLTPATRLGGIGIAIGLGYTVLGVTWATIVSGVVAMLLAVGIAIRYANLRPSIPSVSDVKSFYSLSVPLSIRNIGSVLYSRIDILMVGFLLSPEVVGIYSIAVLLSGVLALPLTAVNQLFPPVASRLLYNDRGHSLRIIHTTITRWTLTVTLFMTLVLIIYRIEILRLFGPEFPAGEVVVLLFAVGQLTNGLACGIGYLFTVTERRILLVLNQWVFGILNVGLNYLFINRFGFVGAALATALVYICLNLIRLIQLWYLEGYLPYTAGTVKPVIGALVAGTVMVTVRGSFEGVFTVFVGVSVGFIIYGIALIAFGIEETDREFFCRLIERIDSRIDSKL